MVVGKGISMYLRQAKLSRIAGLKIFRPCQKEVIDKVVANNESIIKGIGKAQNSVSIKIQ